MIKEINDLALDIEVLRNYYDAIRVVNPINHRVIQLTKVGTEFLERELPDERCFDIWKVDKPCENCISMQCAQSLKTFVKLEFVDEKVFFIVTIPVKSSKGSILIMELLRDVTGQDVLGGLLSFGNSRGNGIDIRTRILELNEMAVMDGLTGLYNRRYLNEKLPVEMLQSKHNEKELSLIMLDIDHFKKVNDVYGHAAGDIVIQWIADELVQQIAHNGWVARYGGEEFTVCLPGFNLEQASELAENVRLSVEKAKIPICNGEELNVTISAGVSSSSESNREELLKVADKRLYAAKRNGRNQVISACNLHP